MSAAPDTRRVADEDLARRLTAAVARSYELLGRDHDGRPPDAEELAALIDALQRDGTAIDALQGDGAAIDPIGGGKGVPAPAQERDRDLQRLRGRYETRLAALHEAERAVDALRQETSPDTVLAHAPRELCEHSALHRVVLGLLAEGCLTAAVVHIRDDPGDAAATLAALRRTPIRLAHPVVEAELMRRRRATIVGDVDRNLRTHAETNAIMGWTSYVAAPVIVAGETIGALHADTGRGGRPLDVLDGDVLWTFARGLAEVYETVSLRRELRRQREANREFVEWLVDHAAEMSETTMQLITEPPAPTAPPGRAIPFPTGSGRDDRAVFQDLLSRRELEVLRHLVRGESNATIAGQLVIAEATVKFHVVNVLRKLHVSNRAEAVALYHRLVRRRPDPEPV